jgi:hypothetical protein
MAKVIWTDSALTEPHETLMQSAKEIAIEVIGSLPDDCTLDDIEYRLYLRRKLENAERAIDERCVHSFEEG